MKTLPLLISVPHAGLTIPDEIKQLNQLTALEIMQDGDEGAREIYANLENNVAHFVTTEIARAFIDLNRAQDDFHKDGVVKTHTCWDVPIYREPLTSELITTLLTRYYHPYHHRLTKLAHSSLLLGVDCHTMAETAPPVAPDYGQTRPQVCISNANGACPRYWAELLVDCFQNYFSGEVTLNQPFSGGYITRYHGREMPWIQIELNRATFASHTEKGNWVLAALTDWVKKIQ